ncbi:glycosyltransferase [Altericroceibacterium xinjiangense]|uniref:glycosyltransferase n=1 Tax=Altericroceibacterium xinjiangense TaxID=762261 RepID=UPI0013DF88FA|nr:glycosyltransferase [Altericroceibacterium xinjiangense]
MTQVNQPPEIAILLDHFGPGGVERVACHVANGLHRRGFRVEMLVLRDAGPVRTLLDPAIPVHAVGAVQGLSRGARMIAAVPALARYLRRRNPGILHSPGNHAHVAAYLATTLAGYTGAFVPKMTNPVLKAGLPAHKLWLRKRMYGRILRRARKILVLSAGGVARLAELGADIPARTRFVHNPYVDDSAVRRQDSGVPADPPLILCVGRLSRQKNQALLLRAAARLRDKEWQLRLCGVGPEEDALRTLAKDLNIADRVDFAGFTTDLRPHYVSATMVALPSRWEDLPATLLEAVAFGCPVVSTACSPAVVELLRDLGAREPVAPEDEAQLAAALEEGLEGRLPQASRSASLAYSIDHSCEEHAAIFAALLSSREAQVPGTRHDRLATT